MNRLSPVRYDENEVVDTCGRAARRLWTRTGSVASRATHLDSLVGDLLNAIATAAAAEGASVPEGVQHAALRVARSVRARHERGASVGHHGHDLSSVQCGVVRPGVGRDVVSGEDAVSGVAPYASGDRTARVAFEPRSSSRVESTVG